MCSIACGWTRPQGAKQEGIIRKADPACIHTMAVNWGMGYETVFVCLHHSCCCRHHYSEDVLHCMLLDKAVACKAGRHHQDSILEMPAELLQGLF